MGKMIYTNGRFHFEAPRKEEVRLAKLWGLQWNADTLRWVTRNPAKAVALRRFADASAERKLKKSFITDLAPPEQIQYPDHLSPKTWQLESAWHALTRTPAYVADEAGLGKTIVACLCINSRPGKTLIICPPFLKYNWQAELTKWCGGHDFSMTESGNADASFFDAPVVILPDSLLTNERIQTLIRERKWEWCFIDEAHRYKEATTKRTIALVGDGGSSQGAITDSAKRVVFLSGTPIPNGRPIELYPLLSAVAHQSIGHRSLAEYGKRFCAGKQVARFEGRRKVLNWDFMGASNLAQLRAELREKLMIRHLKRDHLKELGPKTRQVIFLDEVQKLHTLEKEVLAHHSMEELLGEDAELGDIATYRREVGEAKLIPAFTYINELLETSPDKLVVFAHHVSVVEGLARMLEPHKPLMIRGGMPAKEKALRAAHFQNKPEHRVIIGNMDAMGVGLTLTQAPGVVVVEPSWVPGVNEQAEDRVHRMTQKQNVYIRYLVLRNSLDERMLTQVLNKERSINQVMD